MNLIVIRVNIVKVELGHGLKEKAPYNVQKTP